MSSNVVLQVAGRPLRRLRLEVMDGQLAITGRLHADEWRVLAEQRSCLLSLIEVLGPLGVSPEDAAEIRTGRRVAWGPLREDVEPKVP